MINEFWKRGVELKIVRFIPIPDILQSDNIFIITLNPIFICAMQ
jgi:hypothetical protein